MSNECKYFTYKVRCSECGKTTAPRLPRAGRHKGDGTVWFPRRHKINGKDCEGNILEGELLSIPNASNK